MIFEKQKTLKASDRFVQDICGLPDIVKNNTIILIGPMGTGKSTVAKLLENQIEGMHRISLDNKELLKNLYERERKFKDFKNFEFVLTGTVLSSLKEPYIIDVGAGHSIYEDKNLREQMRKMCVIRKPPAMGSLLVTGCEAARKGVKNCETLTYRF